MQMATLTYDPTEDTGEFSAEEQESIQIGEHLEQEQQRMLAGKYENAEQLERAYMELQQKFSGRQEDNEQPTAEAEEVETEEQVEEAPEEGSNGLLDALWNAQQNDSVTEELINEINNMSAEDLAAEYLEYRNNGPQAEQISPEQVNELYSSVGGENAYAAMVQWAGQNLNENEIGMFDAVMERGDPLACYFAVQTLNNLYQNNVGVDGEMLGGRTASEPVDGFRSQAELVRAMSDPRYEQDPAYRDDVARKLERSNEIVF